MELLYQNKELSFLQNLILTKKCYILCLQKRLSLMRKNYTLKCEYEKNEIDIITHETCELISIKTKKLIDLESKFKLKSNQFFVDINELDQNYNNLIELAKKYQTESFELKHFLYAVNWKLINENIIEKINFYKDLKFTMQPYLPELNNE